MEKSYTGLQGLTEIIADNKYICNYPADLDTDNIISSRENIAVDIFIKGDELISYEFPRCDIIDRFNVNVSYDCDFYLKFGECNNFVYKEHLKKGDNVIRPFKFGIPLIKMVFQRYLIVIHNTNKNTNFDCKVSVDTIYLDSPDRRFLSETHLHIGEVNIFNGMWKQDSYIECPFSPN
jgi:hypothetical protein